MNVCNVRNIKGAETELDHFYWGPKLDWKLREMGRLWKVI